MDDPRRGLGMTGERLAAQHLTDAGMRIVQRNWRNAVGEIDIIAHDIAPDYSVGLPDATWLVIVEVRTRRGMRYGAARQSITPRKAAKLRQVGASYVQHTGWTGPWRIDMVAVQMDRAGHLLGIDHIRHAIGAEADSP